MWKRRRRRLESADETAWQEEWGGIVFFSEYEWQTYYQKQGTLKHIKAVHSQKLHIPTRQ